MTTQNNDFDYKFEHLPYSNLSVRPRENLDFVEDNSKNGIIHRWVANFEKYTKQHLKYTGLSPRYEDDPTEDFFEYGTGHCWVFEDGIPILVKSDYPESIYREYLETRDNINFLSKCTHPDTPIETPNQQKLKIEKIKLNILET